jgi:starvation-inducible DNA-binding protein
LGVESRLCNDRYVRRTDTNELDLETSTGREGDMATQTQRTFATRIDIPEASREKLVELLNARLADAFDLYSQLKQAHWNVKGSDFIQLHELYDDVAESVLEHVDEIAERATALGGLALGTARMAASASTLDEYPLGAVAGMDTVEAIADRLSAYGASVRTAIEAALELEDQDTADLFIEVSRALDKHLWFVEAHLQS